MRTFFFLPRSAILMIFSLVGLSFFVSWFLKFLILLVIGFVLFCRRRLPVPFRDTFKDQGEIYLAPVHGRVVSIRRNVRGITDFLDEATEIRLQNSFLDEHGLYLPSAMEAAYLKAFTGTQLPLNFDTIELNRLSVNALSRTELTLLSKNVRKTHFLFLDRKFGVRPQMWLKSGDRGRASACFGYYPFGGTLLVYLPSDCDVLVYPGEKTQPGQTVLAVLKG